MHIQLDKTDHLTITWEGMDIGIIAEGELRIYDQWRTHYIFDLAKAIKTGTIEPADTERG